MIISQNFLEYEYTHFYVYVYAHIKPTCCSYNAQKTGNVMNTAIMFKTDLVSEISISVNDSLARSSQCASVGSDHEVIFERRAYYLKKVNWQIKILIYDSQFFISLTSMQPKVLKMEFCFGLIITYMFFPATKIPKSY